MTLHYGVSSLSQLKDTAQAVCKCLGFGVHGFAAEALLEICAVETAMGHLKCRHPDRFGVCQMKIDDIEWISSGYTRRKRDIDFRERILVNTGFDIYDVTPQELDQNVLLAMVFMRIKMHHIEEYIPISLYMRAAYWHQYLSDNRFHSSRRYLQAHRAFLAEKKRV